MESCFVCHSYIAPRSGSCPSCGTVLIIRRRAILQRRNTLPISLRPSVRDLEVLEMLSADGFATAFRARDRNRGQTLVLEVVHPWLCEGWLIRRLMVRQLKMLSGLRGDHLVPIVAAGQTQEGLPYWLRPEVAGETLRELVDRQGMVSEALLLEIGDQILAALEQAHGAGILHRALTPDDVLIQSASLPRVMVKGFGLANIFKSARLPAPATTGAELTQRAPYFAPEEFLDEPAEARGDLYSAGALLYFLATGQPPLAIARSDEIVLSVLRKEPLPPRPRARDLSSAVETVILEALAKYPEDRFRSASAMRAALRSRPATLAPEIGHRERQARPRPRRLNTRVALTAGALVLVLAALSFGIGQLAAAAARPSLVLGAIPLAALDEMRFTLQGRADLGSAQTLLLDGLPVPIREGGAFDAEVPVPAGRSQHRLSFRGAGDFTPYDKTFALVGASAPQLGLVTPPAGSATWRDSCHIRVQSDRPLASAAADLTALEVNGARAEGNVPLAVGANQIRLALVDQHGRSTEQVIEVTRRAAPRIEIESPTAGAQVARPIVTGHVVDADGLRLMVGTREIPLQAGAFSLALEGADGPLSADLALWSADGAEAESRIEFVLDTTPPTITLQPSAVSSGLASLVGTVSDAAPGELASFEMDRQPQLPAADGSFRIPLGELPEGVHTITLAATDKAGNRSTCNATVTIDRTPPSLALLEPAEPVSMARATEVPVRARVDDQNPRRVVWESASGAHGSADVIAGGEARFRLALASGVNRFTLNAEDAAGLRSKDLVLSCYCTPPPSITALQADPIEVDGRPSLSVSGTASAPLWRAEVNSQKATVSKDRFTVVLPDRAAVLHVVLWDRAGTRIERDEPTQPQAALGRSGP
jgi:hypothetical protein